MISAAQFRKIFPHCPKALARTLLPLLVAAMIEFEITTRRRAAAFLAQVGHESLDFKYMEEEIASGAAYEGRQDLGNVERGDGKRFKGRGPIQITGRSNYQRAEFALRLPLVAQPELLSIPANGMRAAGWFWDHNKLNLYADTLSGEGDRRDIARFDKITYRVNGGYNGRAERQQRYLNALDALSDADFTEASPIPATLDH
ncbi:MAG: glycoside hydrolase family 19 protein, partial [Pyrinomonadaceae bacterium]